MVSLAQESTISYRAESLPRFIGMNMFNFWWDMKQNKYYLTHSTLYTPAFDRWQNPENQIKSASSKMEELVD